MRLICLVSILAGCLIAKSWAGDCDITGTSTTTKPGTSKATTAAAGAGTVTTTNAGRTTSAAAGAHTVKTTTAGTTTSAAAGTTTSAAVAAATETTSTAKRRKRGATGQCMAYDSVAASGDNDCSKLQKYIGCTFAVDSKTPCDVPTADHALIVKQNCPGMVGVCRCELNYYKSDLSTHLCTAVTDLETCLNSTNTEKGCDVETKIDIHKFVTERKTKACSTGVNIVAVVPNLLFGLLAAVYL